MTGHGNGTGDLVPCGNASRNALAPRSRRGRDALAVVDADLEILALTGH
jgi:hypothetical protein